MLMDKHRRTPRIPNPAFVEIGQRMEWRDQEIAYLRDLISRLRGRITATKRAADVFAGRAVARFEVVIQAAARSSMADRDLKEEPTPSAPSKASAKPAHGAVITDEDDSPPSRFNGTSYPKDPNNNGATR